MAPSFDEAPASAAQEKQTSAEEEEEEEHSSTPTAHEHDLAERPSHNWDQRARAAELELEYEMAAHQQNGYKNGIINGDLPPLQTQGNLHEEEKASYEPINADDPSSYDLVAPGGPDDTEREVWNLEKQSQLLFSKEHLQVIFADPSLLLKFTSFLGIHRQHSVPILVHYLDSLKALRALHYANAILDGLEPVQGLDFTSSAVERTANAALLKRANDAFEYLAKEELPAFVTHQYIQIVSISIAARISGSLAPHLREASEGLAEVFCLTDPSRPDNPIVFASEEFNRTTQYGMTYILGRNCRFLQGPWTSPLAVRRLREAIAAGKQHQEVFLNYRRDGSPFMNLLMIAPLRDARGNIRYFIGAQVDVSGLVRECVEMDSLQRLIDLQARGELPPNHQKPNPEKNDELRELSEMLNHNELATVRRHGGRMHREVRDEDDATESIASGQPRLLIKDPNTITPPLDDQISLNSNSSFAAISGKLSGVYQHYLLVRPFPSLRILFASPSQRVPGILQSPLMNKIGGSHRVRDELTAALAEGRGVTAKVRWVTKNDEEGRNKWIHCTPLVGIEGKIGVWMVVIVDDERSRAPRAYMGRQAPPVSTPERSRARNAHSGSTRGGRDSMDGGQGSINSFRIV